MQKPYVVCHMMASVDGRIDCAMTEQLPGVQEYYATLEALQAPTRVSGRVTAQLEMALPGEFHSENPQPLGREDSFCAMEAAGYEVVVDTDGSLLWPDQAGEERPLLVVTGEQVSRDYLESAAAAYLVDRLRTAAGRSGSGLRAAAAGVRRAAHGCGRRRAYQRRVPGCGPAG